jgi:hypothetical protein
LPSGWGSRGFPLGKRATPDSPTQRYCDRVG